jgi:transcriptional regulator with XRE-family HTH domain
MDGDGVADRFRVLMEAHRLERGVTLAELAVKIGLSHRDTGYLSRVERGLVVPSFDRAVAIAQALGISMEEFDG